jgi:hypothetical protein
MKLPRVKVWLDGLTFIPLPQWQGSAPDLISLHSVVLAWIPRPLKTTGRGTGAKEIATRFGPWRLRACFAFSPAAVTALSATKKNPPAPVADGFSMPMRTAVLVTNPR